jgi:multidrug efflux pump subunit AcrA (membrane-fusion protein)
MKVKKIVWITWLLIIAGCKNADKTAPQALNKIEPTEAIAIGRVEPEKKIASIGSQVNGIVKHLYVHAGDTVKKNQVLVELVHNYEDALLLQAKSKRAAQRAEIESAKAQLNSVKIKSESLHVKLLRTQKTVAGEADTKQSLDNAQTDYDQSVADIDRYNAMLMNEQAKLDECEADIALVQAQIEQRKITAPSDGIVLNMDLTEGSPVATSKSLFDFAPNSPLTVLCEVDELFANKVKVGQTAFIRNQGMDEKLASGDVIFVGSYFKKKSLFSDDSGNMEDRRVREVRILIKDNKQLLFNERVEAVINIK